MRLMLLVASLCLLLGLGLARAEEPIVKPEAGTELAKINATLGEILRLLKQGSERQDVDLLMKRVQLADSRVAELGRQLRQAETELHGMETEKGSLEMRLGMLGLQRESAESPKLVQQFEVMESEAKGQMKRLMTRMGQIAADVGALKSELEASREDLQDWRRTLDRRLAKFGG